MTVPIWALFALLSVVCALFPLPTWVRRVHWLRVVGLWACLSFCIVVWYGVFRLVWWLA